MLKRIMIVLQDKWNHETDAFCLKMKEDGIQCIYQKRSADESCEKRTGTIEPDTGTKVDSHTLLLTDDQNWSMAWKKQGGICVGVYAGEDSVFFEGAELVVDGLQELNRVILEETLLHGLGLPVTIAQTERLLLKEITKEDVECLYQISLQDSMVHLMPDPKEDNCFQPERMFSYIKNVYRFYGYGLWSVWTKTGKLIGCCGFQDFVKDGADNQTSIEENSLELQYMLDEKYQGYGYGTEMCKAALTYVFERTACEEVWLRVHPDNLPSVHLAQKLGFCLTEEGLFQLKKGKDLLREAF